MADVDLLKAAFEKCKRELAGVDAEFETIIAESGGPGRMRPMRAIRADATGDERSKATVRRLVNMTALAVVQAAAQG